MKEHLTVDSVMTADGEVVLLGPVDKDGHRVPLDTTDLYGPRGEHYKVKSFVHFPLMDGWAMPALTGAAARCARRGRSTASATAFTPCSRVMANELLFLWWIPHRVHSLCARPRRP